MTITSHGIDLVDTARIADMLQKHGEHFLLRVFTDAERAYCDASHKRRIEHYAARFAAKEAALKALGTGWRNGIAWTDVEVVKQPTGQPLLRVHGEVAELAAEQHITRWLVSLSHTETHAIASVIALTEE